MRGGAGGRARSPATLRVRCGLAVVAVLVGAAVLGACGGNEYRWVEQRQRGRLLQGADGAGTTTSWPRPGTQGRADALPGSITPVWHVYFDSAKGTAPQTDGNDLPADLVGNAQIYTLSNYYRENYSISQVREQLFHGVDPVYPPDDLQGRVELVSYRPIEEGEGLTGSRVVANINLAEDGGDEVADRRRVRPLRRPHRARLRPDHGVHVAVLPAEPLNGRSDRSIVEGEPDMTAPVTSPPAGVGFHAVHEPHSEDREPKTRRPMMVWDRIKILVILTLFIVLSASYQQSRIPVMSFGEALEPHAAGQVVAAGPDGPRGRPADPLPHQRAFGAVAPVLAEEGVRRAGSGAWAGSTRGAATGSSG